MLLTSARVASVDLWLADFSHRGWTEPGGWAVPQGTWPACRTSPSAATNARKAAIRLGTW